MEIYNISQDDNAVISIQFYVKGVEYVLSMSPLNLGVHSPSEKRNKTRTMIRGLDRILWRNSDVINDDLVEITRVVDILENAGKTESKKSKVTRMVYDNLIDLTGMLIPKHTNYLIEGEMPNKKKCLLIEQLRRTEQYYRLMSKNMNKPVDSIFEKLVESGEESKQNNVFQINANQKMLEGDVSVL